MTFKNIAEHPVPVDINTTDEGGGIPSTFRNNCAKWHASCRLKCSASRLARIAGSTKMCIKYQYD